MPEPGAGAALLRVRFRAGGLAFASKLKPHALRNLEAEVHLRRQHVVLHPYPEPGSTGRFDDGTVAISAGGETVSERRHARRLFGGRRRLWWDHLDLLYFAGYALWNYVALPFRMWDLPHRELPPEASGLRRFEFTFPNDLHTHSRVQTFHVDDGRRIHRHDYTAEVFGRWARAAHLGTDWIDVGGTPIATRRRVVPRLRSGRVLPGPALVWIVIDDIAPAPEAEGGHART